MPPEHAPAHPAQPEQTGNYRLLNMLGEGGGGTVFRAEQISTGQLVAVKLLRSAVELDPLKAERLIARFERETMLCAQLHHPHIVKLLDKGQTASGQLYAVFEYVPGETLKQLLVRRGSLTALEAGELMGQVLDALACAHAQGIAHRDLKPQNIMTSATGARVHVKVLDFGIAAFIPEQQKADYRNLTMTSEMMCSPSYSAPEHLRGEPPTIKTDLYAWGLLFLECLTGRPAIEGITLADIFHQQLSATEVPLPPALVGHPLADLLRRALRKNPRERAESAATLYQDFKTINLANIVGGLHSHWAGAQSGGHTTTGHQLTGSTQSGAHGGIVPDIDPNGEIDFGMTQEARPGQFGLSYQYQQISVLSCTLNVISLDPTLEAEVLEALQRDQLSMCSDSAARYGGYLAGSLGNSLLYYFGYPHVAEDDARRCARTALELNSQAQRRNALLAGQGCRIDIRIGIHSGMVAHLPGTLPTGITPNTAIQLERLAAAGAILLSDTSRQILGQHVECEANGREIGKNDGQRLACFAVIGENKSEAVFLTRTGQISHGMIGREDELAQLQANWQQALGGNGCACLLQGEAGIGKSRLAHELSVMARRDAAIVLEVRCLPENQNNALQPVLTLLKNHLHLQDVAAPDAVAHLAKTLGQVGVNVAWVLPILCSWLALPIPPEYPAMQFAPERQKSLLLDALQSVMLSIGQDETGYRPLRLILIEDLHWMDQTSLELMQRLVSHIGHGMILMTARPTFACPWPQVQTLLLGHLSEAASRQLVSAVLGGKAIEASALQRLCQRSDGIPLFIEELTRMLQSNGMLVERDGVVQLDVGFETGAIPVTLRDLLSARLTRLGAALDTAQLAASIGREFDYALLAEVALVDQATLQTDLEQLIAADLIHRQRKVSGDSFIFRHALIRDAAYDSMPRLVREQTHARIAHRMEDADEAEIERSLGPLAQHFAWAQEFAPAVKYGTRAAQIFLARTLNTTALAQAELVQGWIEKMPQEQRRSGQLVISRVLAQIIMLRDGWGSESARAATEYELSLIEGGSNAQEALPTLCALALYHNTAGHRQTAHTMMEHCLALAGASDNQGVLAACTANFGFFLWLEGDYQQAEQQLTRALENFDPAIHAANRTLFGLDSEMMALSIRSHVKWFTRLDDGPAFDEMHANIAHQRELNHIPSLGLGLVFQGILYQYSGNIEKTLATARELQELAREYSLPALDGYIGIVYAWCVSDLALCDRILAILRQLGCMSGYTYYSSLAAELAARGGDWVSAFERIEESLKLGEEMGELYYKPELLMRRARYRSHTPLANPELSRSDLQLALDFAQAKGMVRCVQRAREQMRELSGDT
jgi:TOMM system kinase/cyclase fusion protein